MGGTHIPTGATTRGLLGYHLVIDAHSGSIYVLSHIFNHQYMNSKYVFVGMYLLQTLRLLRFRGKPVSQSQRSRMSHVTAGVAEKSLRQPRRYSVSKVKVGFLAKASIERRVYNSVRFLGGFHKLRGHSECMPLYRLPVNLYFLQILPPSRLSHSQNS